jgi:hypothetical protein
VTLPRSGLRAQIVATAVFTVFAVGLIVFARSLRSAADEALALDADEAQQPAPPRRPGPLTPKTATTARQMHAALLTAFGNNARDMTCVTYVDYDRHPDRLHICFALDDADITAPSARVAGLARMRDILHAVYDGDMPWTWVLVTATAPVRDKNGGFSESTVIRAQFARDRLRRVDWDKFTAQDVQSAAEQFWLHLDLALHSPAAPTTAPTTAPAPAPATTPSMPSAAVSSAG